MRKGAKILEAAWRAEPHPDIAGLYVHARPGDAVLDRLGRARKLQEMKKNHPESSLAVARAALEAGDFATARSEAEAAIRMDRREGAYLLLADIEEAETGDEGKVRQLLAKAVRAPQDPAWIADGVTSERWAPASPVTGRIDAFRWLAPAERLGRLIEAEEPEAAIAPVLAAPAEPELPEGPVTIEAAAEQAQPAQAGPAPVSAEEEAARAEPQRLPDDPGVEPEDEAERQAGRFRLF